MFNKKVNKVVDNVIFKWYYISTVKRKEVTKMTVEELISILKHYPADTKILIEGHDGGSSALLTDKHITDWWSRDIQSLEKNGTEKIMLFSLHE